MYNNVIYENIIYKNVINEIVAHENYLYGNAVWNCCMEMLYGNIFYEKEKLKNHKEKLLFIMFILD
jgi:hypothetical protein